ncbi:MAG: beta-ketoacyl-ACP synthase 3 [Actinomycetota bacterium]
MTTTTTTTTTSSAATPVTARRPTVQPTKGGAGGPRSRLLSIGTALPPGKLTNADFEAMMDTDDEWIRTRTGISERRVGSTTTALATKAARVALERSGLAPDLIDLVIVATQTPDDLCPSTAAGVQHALGLRCGAFDLNAACAGFGYGVVTAHSMLGSAVRAAIVVGVDRMTAATNYEDRSTAILFGDGAGAVVIARDDVEPMVEVDGTIDMTTASPASGGPRRGILAWDMGTDGSRPDILKSPITEGRITGVEMDGKQVFKTMVRYAEGSARSALERAGLGLDDVTAVLAHQANQRILDTVADRLGIERERFPSVIATTGNTSAASVPLALEHAVRAGQVREGDVVLLMGFGGGLSWATAVAVWG